MNRVMRATVQTTQQNAAIFTESHIERGGLPTDDVQFGTANVKIHTLDVVCLCLVCAAFWTMRSVEKISL